MECIVYYPKLKNNMNFCGYTQQGGKNYTLCGMDIIENEVLNRNFFEISY